ncbi:hypothetical protein [Candidatus Villigracilis affinis]|uniref:hypothetical protein n=1 Tax=Candidatus Villigracilis affinis TaxID=3140682 RepID=UPI002A23129B|nr:hypothetical protein [Anaerolineales bacterium]
MLTSAQAIQVFSQMFGLYPHKTLSIVIADFQDSMEFSALYFHSRSFYNLYDGSPQSYLITVAAHETGHQWWFDQVANDQAQEPWLDESRPHIRKRSIMKLRTLMRWHGGGQIASISLNRSERSTFPYTKARMPTHINISSISMAHIL